MNDDGVEKNIQRRIYNLLKSNPGLHITKIVELLNMNIAEVENWLRFLVEKKLVQTTLEDGYQRYYIESEGKKGRDQRTQEMRTALHAIVEKNPGIYLTKIAELLQISVQLADYYLVDMQRENEIISVKNRGEYHKRYYTIQSQIVGDEQKILYLLGHRIALEIVLLLLKYQTLKHKDLTEMIGVSPSKLSYHLTKLLQEGILDVCPHGEGKGFVLSKREEMKRILKKYRLRIEGDLAVEGFMDIWDDFHYEN